MTDIEKGNKLIGEFMNSKLWCFIQGSSNIFRAEIHISEYDKYKKRGYTRFDLPYKSDWNSMMEVIDKIENIGHTYVDLYKTGCAIHPIIYNIKKDCMEVKPIISVNGKDKLESTWLTVVDFLTTYKKVWKAKSMSVELNDEDRKRIIDAINAQDGK